MAGCGHQGSAAKGFPLARPRTLSAPEGHVKLGWDVPAPHPGHGLCIPPPNRHLDTHVVSCVCAQGRLYLQLPTAPSPSVRVHAQGRQACGRGRTWGLGEGAGRLALAPAMLVAPPQGRGEDGSGAGHSLPVGFCHPCRGKHLLGLSSSLSPPFSVRRSAVSRCGEGRIRPPAPLASSTPSRLCLPPPNQSPWAPVLAPLTWCSSGWTCTAPRSSAPSAGSPPR